ncbi:hypothetical protein Tco_0134444 [Tanacetum coccineum]
MPFLILMLVNQMSSRLFGFIGALEGCLQTLTGIGLQLGPGLDFIVINICCALSLSMLDAFGKKKADISSLDENDAAVELSSINNEDKGTQNKKKGNERSRGLMLSSDVRMWLHQGIWLLPCVYISSVNDAFIYTPLKRLDKEKVCNGVFSKDILERITVEKGYVDYDFERIVTEEHDVDFESIVTMRLISFDINRKLLLALVFSNGFLQEPSGLAQMATKGAKKEWGLSPKEKVRVLHTAQLDVTVSSNH